jgi:hypothetical protein
MTYEVTLTDAIHDGESWTANGSIVHRHTIELPNDHGAWAPMREARKLFGYSGVSGRYISDDAWMPYNSTMMIHIQENY